MVPEARRDDAGRGAGGHAAAPGNVFLGRIGRALVTEGALVGQGEATQLALVQKIDPMYVNIAQPVADVLRLRAALASGQLKGTGQVVPVRIVLDDGSVYPQPGRLIFSDLTVDPGSGQITLRAEVPNPKGLLLPGMNTDVEVHVGRRDSVAR